MGVSMDNWSIDHKKFRKHLWDEYGISDAYYYFGYLNENLNNLYTALQRAGFIFVFKEHSKTMLGEKRGNVDTDIVFEIMRMLLDESQDFDLIYLVSGDGDYYKMVRYLISKNRFGRILFPNGKFASSLYNQINNTMKVSMNRLRNKIEYVKK